MCRIHMILLRHIFNYIVSVTLLMRCIFLNILVQTQGFPGEKPEIVMGFSQEL